MFLTTGPAFPMAGLVAIASALIFAIRYFRPEASREYDIVFSVTGLIYAACLLIEGYRLIPLLFFAQVLLVVMAAFFAVETFRLRLLLVEKSRQFQGRPTRREGFTRTYKPGQYESSRVVTTRSVSGRRMRTVTDDSRSLGEEGSRRSRPQPQLTSETTSGRPSRRPRPKPPIDDEIIEDIDVNEVDTWDEEDTPQRPVGQRPRRSPRRSDRPDSRRSAGEQSRQRPETRRRPPRLPDDEIPGRADRVIQVEPIIEDDEDDSFDARYDDPRYDDPRYDDDYDPREG